MSKHSHISAIFDNAFQSRSGSPDVYMSMVSPFISIGLETTELLRLSFASSIIKIPRILLEGIG